MSGLQSAGQASTLPSIDKYLSLPQPHFKGFSVLSPHALCLMTLPVWPHLAGPAADLFWAVLVLPDCPLLSWFYSVGGTQLQRKEGRGA